MPFKPVINILRQLNQQALINEATVATRRQVLFAFKAGYYPGMRRGAIFRQVEWEPRVPWREYRNDEYIEHNGDYPPLRLSGELLRSVKISALPNGVEAFVPRTRTGSTPEAPQLGKARAPALLGDIHLKGGTNERRREVPARPFMPTGDIRRWSWATDSVNEKIRGAFRRIAAL